MGEGENRSVVSVGGRLAVIYSSDRGLTLAICKVLGSTTMPIPSAVRVHPRLHEPWHGTHR